MNQRDKLFDKIRTNLVGVRFDDACRMAEQLGFIHTGGKGSHRAFARTGEPVGLNFQNRNGCIPVYQARQLLGMIEKYKENS